MASYDNSVTKDTYDLVFRYNNRPSFRKSFDEALKLPGVIIFKRRPIKFYIFTLSRVLPEYASYYREVRNDKTKFGDFLILIGKNQKKELDRLERAWTNPQIEIFQEPERAGFLEAEEEASEFKRAQRFDKFLDFSTAQQTPPQVTLPSTRLGQIPVKPGLTPIAPTIPVPGAAATILPLTTSNPWVGGILILVGFVAVLFLTGFNFLENTALFPPTQQPLSPTEGGAPVAFSDITNCQFTRGDMRPPTASYKSNRLLGYFKEASEKSGVPAPLLAAIARVESPGITNFRDAGLESFGCPTSPTGARGLMQIQPPGTIGHNSTALTLGAQYLEVGEDKVDLCNIRHSIFVGAAFVNSRRLGGKWDNSKSSDKSYIDSVAETYYGCLKYPSCTNGPYSYGDDLWNSLQSCQALQPSESLAEREKPPEIASSKLREAILRDFSIDMEGFSENQLKWAWEKFWDVKQTKFNKLVRGPGNTVRVRAVDAGSEQIHCSLVLLRKTINDPVLFKIVLIHELSHVIYWCNDDAVNRVTEHANVYAQEGAVTGYGEPVNGTTCYGTPARTENYPEMITYYLNRGVVEQTGCNLRGQVPFANGRFPLHYNLARKIMGGY